MRSVLLDTVSDGLAALSVTVVGGIIFVTRGMYWLDSAAAIVIGCVIGFGALGLLRDVIKSLRSGEALELSDDWAGVDALGATRRSPSELRSHGVQSHRQHVPGQRDWLRSGRGCGPETPRV